ncbi:MAG: 4-hydroxythreonine-4-phosphate dehydrogenase PdxA [Cyanobacteriota bacterium]|nr:4-hydroxythreonine-4-phosphate dehydrogenase PdxA [Cyanobacteriota bacterium]
MRPRLAITLGDPAGIGPEVVLKALAEPAIARSCDFTLVGTQKLLEQTYKLLSPAQLLADPESLKILNVDLEKGDIVPGEGNGVTGALSFAYLEEAIARTLAGEFQGIVTAPIAKNYWQAAGRDYPGQTELLAERAGVEKFGMLFVAKSPQSNFVLRTLLATTHIPLCQVPSALTPELMTLKLELLISCLREDFGIEKPTIAVSGLNPHSGEDGKLGKEEKEWLIPWLKKESDRFSDVQLLGPIPPDTMWVKPGQAWQGNSNIKAADGYLALYHDQGLIPVKLMAFDLAVNTTIGLPFIRTSPDHGTAFDIAGKGIADPTSMKAAIELAIELVK